MILEHKSLSLLSEALAELDAGFAELPDFEATVDVSAMRTVLLEVAQRMQDNYPYPHPFYAGQMLKPPHTIARLAYALAQWINPNNHALDGGRASSALEKEAVAAIAQMFGWDQYLGHLCGGGTMANLEALWVAGRLHPEKRIVASQQAHYTHARISEVLQLPFQAIPCDSQARMDLAALAAVLRTGDVGTVVVTLGTTAAGAVDPLPAILELQAHYGFRIHVDTAYGGYFKLVDNLNDPAQAAYAAIHHADSIAIDPHKHGLQPYGCGCILFKDPSVGTLYKHDSPYTYFSSAELHLGEISLECSRAGAAAVALWATQRLFPLARGGEFADMLADCRAAAVALATKIEADPRMRLAFDPELDIVVWGVRAKSASQISALSRSIFEEAARANLHLAVANFPATMLQERWPDVEWDQEQVACLRSCLMKPEHREWVERIWAILDCVTETMLTSSSTP